MLNKALHWIVALPNSRKVVMHADMMQARYDIACRGGEWFVEVSVDQGQQLRKGPYPDPWRAMEIAERWCREALGLAGQQP